MPTRLLPFAIIPLALWAGGCRSPYASDRLAGAGALLGGGAGAIIGAQQGKAAEGALIGAALGTGAGAITGGAIDDAEARNRAAIESRLGHPLPPGGVSVNDVIAMTRAGVPGDVIVSHIEARGMGQEILSGDLIHMQSQGVDPAVMAAAGRPPRSPLVVRPVRPRTVYLDDPWYDPCPYHYRRYHFHRCRPHAGVGFSFHHH